jgi:hypothetical protein
MQRIAISCAAGLFVALAALPVQAQLLGPNLAPAPAGAVPDTSPAPVIVAPQQAVDDRVAFNSAERWIIPTYFGRVREKQYRASRSKTYQRALPAGLSTDPAKGDLLPLPLLARLDRLPGPLVRDLPPNRPNTDRVVVGKNVLMVNTATGEVLDIMPNMVY